MIEVFYLMHASVKRIQKYRVRVQRSLGALGICRSNLWWLGFLRLLWFRLARRLYYMGRTREATIDFLVFDETLIDQFGIKNGCVCYIPLVARENTIFVVVRELAGKLVPRTRFLLPYLFRGSAGTGSSSSAMQCASLAEYMHARQNPPRAALQNAALTRHVQHLVSFSTPVYEPWRFLNFDSSWITPLQGCSGPASAAAVEASARQRAAGTTLRQPKRPLHAFLYYSMEQREYVAKELPLANVAEVSREIGRRWGKLGREERASYEKLAREDRDRYRVQKAEFDTAKSLGLVDKNADTRPEPSRRRPKKLNFACIACGQAFADRWKLRRHELNKHNVERPYEDILPIGAAMSIDDDTIDAPNGGCSPCARGSAFKD